MLADDEVVVAVPLAHAWARAEARDRCAPLMLSRHILAVDLNFVILPVDGLRFEHSYVAIVRLAAAAAAQYSSATPSSTG
jgi:hypothetical protein